jgi:hypothetical protein
LVGSACAPCEIKGGKREKMSKKSAYQTSSFWFYRRQIHSSGARAAAGQDIFLLQRGPEIVIEPMS